jgi:hypothetical protein
MYDFSDVEPQQSSDLIADGSFAKVIMTIRPGGVDGQTRLSRDPKHLDSIVDVAGYAAVLRELVR